MPDEMTLWFLMVWGAYPEITADLPTPETEYRFHDTRRWRFDLAFPDQRLAVEIEGGTWAFGRHNQPAGYESDCEKYNAALLLGWRVLRFTSSMINADPKRVVETVQQALQGGKHGD